MQNIINGLPIAAVILLLAVGFAFLVKGADFFVEGSSSIAKKLKVPPIIIGLTIVAMEMCIRDRIKGTGSMFPIMAIMYAGTSGIPKPTAYGIAPRSSISGTIEIRKTIR